MFLWLLLCIYCSCWRFSFPDAVVFLPSVLNQEMAKILNHPRVYAFLHVPVQSASDSVLMDMKREYCIDDFKRVVDFLKDRYAWMERFQISLFCYNISHKKQCLSVCVVPSVFLRKVKNERYQWADTVSIQHFWTVSQLDLCCKHLEQQVVFTWTYRNKLFSCWKMLLHLFLWKRMREQFTFREKIILHMHIYPQKSKDILVIFVLFLICPDGSSSDVAWKMII